MDHNISIRALDVNDLEDLRVMRIRALTLHTGYFMETPEQAKAHKEDYWLERLDNKGKRVFGLYDSATMIGITAVFTWRKDPTGKTGIMGYSFIEPKYRAQGYSSHLYKARLDFALKHEPWTKLHISHRRGNLPSRAAIIKHGFQYVGTEDFNFPDQTCDLEHHYELDLCVLRQDNG
ncbi:MAG: GNAT family N-acetyltransferase [Alphaproteobacteria bacterium]|nr:GNAT family N-acetyltransferase [Alphaproteobacteria bacterium]